MERRKFLKSLLLSPLLAIIPVNDEYDHSGKIITNTVINIDAPDTNLIAESFMNCVFELKEQTTLWHPDDWKNKTRNEK